MNGLLFLLNSVLVGMGSSMVLLQTAEVPPVLSVAYRMLLAGLILLLLAWRSGTRILLDRKSAGWVASQGVLMFGLAYVAFYNAAGHIPSGIAALVLSLSPVMTALVAWVSMGTKCERTELAGMVCGVLGIALIVGPGTMHSLAAGSASSRELITGLSWAVLAAIATACGTVLGARNQKHGLSGIGIIAWGLIFGATACFVVALTLHIPARFGTSISFLASLGYLVLAGSVCAFLLYFELIRRVGPARASFSFVLVPVVAITMSVLFEGLQISASLFAGALAVLFGNILVLSQRARKLRS